MKKLLVAAAALACVGAQAQLSDVAGANYSLDSATGLKWLDVSQTVGLSYDQVQAGEGGWLAQGWRYATGDEINAMFSSNLSLLPRTDSNGGIESAPGDFWIRGVADVDGQAARLFETLGGETKGQVGGNYAAAYVGGVGGRDVGDGHTAWTFGYQGDRFLLTTSFQLDSQSPLDAIGTFGGNGNFLVSPVPEPSVYAMFGLGLAGLGWVARRQLRTASA